MDIRKLLQEVADGGISIDEAEKSLKKLPYEELGFAKLDHHRKVRQGFEEVVFCQGKVTEHLIRIYQTFVKEGIDVLGTRANREQFEAVRREVPEAEFDELSGVLKVVTHPKDKIGKIVICTGGTADVPVAEEAAQTAEFFGTNVVRLYDVGVAGIHRLLSNLDVFQDASCVIAVAGMEGALAGVVGGLVEVPVVAVPTSVGYGANFKGVSALLTMINSCSNGITVVNIDNGYGAGYVATQINQLAVNGIGHHRKNH